MFHMENKGFASSLSDFNNINSTTHLAGAIISINTISLFSDSEFSRDFIKESDCFFSDKSKTQINAIANSDVFNFLTDFDLKTLTILALVLLGLSYLKLNWKVSLVLFIPMVFAFMIIAFTCLITVFLLRYALASYMEVHMVCALLLSICLTPKRLLSGFLTER